MGEPIRLQKILASAGFGSRRGCEVFITEGRVSVDGAVVMELGAKADVESQSVELDGRKIAGPGKLSKSMRDNEERVYYALNKPKGALCTNDDPAGRPVAVQMIPEKRRIFCVGRLDLDTEGLILLTNDGDLTNRLTHPRYGVPKTYLARVEGDMGSIQMRKLQVGMHLAEGRTQGAKVRVRRKEGRHSVLEITISEGMNRQVRRMLARVELKCRSLKRIAIGPIKLGEMDAGEFRKLTTDELDRLNVAISDAEAAGKAPRTEKPERAGKTAKPERAERSERSDSKPERADRNAFKQSESKNDGDEEEMDEEFEDDEGEDAFAAAAALVKKSGGAAATKRRVIDTDDEEIEAEDEELDLDDEDDTTLETSNVDEEEAAELAELERKDAEADSDEEEDEEDDTDIEDDNLSTDEAVKAMDEHRPWEKVAAKGGKAWADRGDTVRDPELIAAAAEHEREAARMLKEKEFNVDGDIRDRGIKIYGVDKRPRAGERNTRAPREDRGERAPRPYTGAGESRNGPRPSKPFEKRGPGGRDAKPMDGERRPREYGERKGHTPRPWEKTKEGGSDRPRPSYNKPGGGYPRTGGSGDASGERKPWVKRESSGDSRGGSDRPRPSYSKPGGFDRGSSDSRGGSDRPRPSYSKPGGFDRGSSDSRGGSDRPRPSYSKPGGFDRGSSDSRGGSGDSRGERKPWVKREGSGDSRGGSDRPRPSYSKPGGSSYPRSGGSGDSRGERKPWVKREGSGDSRGGSDRPRPSYGKPGGSSYPRSGGSGDSRGERKPWVKRDGGDSRGGRSDNRERGARPEGGSSSRSRPWENSRPSGGERSEGGGKSSVRPWEK